MYKGDHRAGEIEIIKPIKVLDTPFVEVWNDRVKFPNGNEGYYYRPRWKYTYGTAVAPVFQGKLLLIREFRHASRAWAWGLIQGFGEPSLTPLQNALKEAQEEAGIIEATLVPVLNWEDAGLKGTLFSATDIVWGESAREDTEAISEVKAFCAAECRTLLMSDEVKCPITLAAIALFLSGALR
ncbi:NUDIX domain-containing protein [Vibrio mediterranei]|uniref:NUDIX domain-containing protein n=1 Tax=Vibrio mediterranei TaxID=689 RepID=UPI00406899DC